MCDDALPAFSTGRAESPSVLSPSSPPPPRARATYTQAPFDDDACLLLCFQKSSLLCSSAPLPPPSPPLPPPPSTPSLLLPFPPPYKPSHVPPSPHIANLMLSSPRRCTLFAFCDTTSIGGVCVVPAFLARPRFENEIPLPQQLSKCISHLSSCCVFAMAGGGVDVVAGAHCVLRTRARFASWRRPTATTIDCELLSDAGRTAALLQNSLHPTATCQSSAQTVPPIHIRRIPKTARTQQDALLSQAVLQCH